MQGRYILIAVVAFISQFGYGQIFEPVKWTHELKITGPASGEIVHKATIEKNWHLYGMNIP